MSENKKTENLNNKTAQIKRIAVLGPILAGICWGGCGYFIRGLTESGLDNPTIIFTRGLFGSVLLFVYLLAFDRPGLKVNKKDLPAILAVGVVGMLMFNYTYNIAVNELSLSLTAVMMATAPVFVLLISAVIFKEKITLKKFICMVAAFAGCAMLSGILDPGATVHFSRLGLIMGIGTAVCNGIYILASKNVMSKGYGAMTVCLYTYTFGALVLIPFTDWSALSDFMVTGPESFMIKGPAGAIIYLLFQSLFSSIIPSVAYMLGMKHVDAGKVAILESGSEPSAAFIIGLLLYSELPTLIGFAGMIISIAAVMILARE